MTDVFVLCGRGFLQRCVEGWGVAGAVEEDDRGEEHGDEGGTEAEVEGGAVTDGADDAWADHVAECVNDEELAGHGGGADLGGDGVEGGRIHWAPPERGDEDGDTWSDAV